MSAIEIIMAVVLLVALITGAVSGLVKQLGTLAGFVAAVLCCRFFGGSVADAVVSAGSEHESVLRFVVYALVFVLAFVAVVLLARLVHATLSAVKLGALNSIAGAIFRAALWLVIGSACLNIYFAICPSDKDRFCRADRPWRAWVVEAAPRTVGFIANS